jgi:prepilin-type N-terminal cleavage/methylation domain-containing protein
MRLVAITTTRHKSPRRRRGTFCAVAIVVSSGSLPLAGRAGEGGEAGTRFQHPALTLPIKGRGPEEKAKCGMTLVELLVVLALLVVIGSIVVPVFTGSFSSVRLRRAGDQIITRWSQARARAIETGEVFQFTYTPDSGTYQVGPWLAVVADSMGAAGSTSATTRSTSATVATATSTDVNQSATTATNENPTGQNVALPDKITFKSGEIAVEDALTAERQVTSLQSRDDAVTTPILFFPDGTTSQASIVIGNDRNQFVRLTLRGLTGVGRATDILSQEEVQRAQR